MITWLTPWQAGQRYEAPPLFFPFFRFAAISVYSIEGDELPFTTKKSLARRGEPGVVRFMA